MLTAAHIFVEIQKLITSKAGVEKYEAERAAIGADQSLDRKTRNKKLSSLKKPGPNEASNWSAWFGRDGIDFAEARYLSGADIAAVKLVNFDPAWVPEYPVFIDLPDEAPLGTSLCRLGFPFHSIKPTFDEAKNSFVFPPNAIPLPIFPIEGIVTRNIRVNTGGQPLGYPIAFLETSSPGLKGQSGGPMIDVEGRVWGIQSQTQHLSLGFDPPVPNSNNQKEHQFLNVGWAVHPATVLGYLKELGITFRQSP